MKLFKKKSEKFLKYCVVLDIRLFNERNVSSSLISSDRKGQFRRRIKIRHKNPYN